MRKVLNHHGNSDGSILGADQYVCTCKGCSFPFFIGRESLISSLCQVEHGSDGHAASLSVIVSSANHRLSSLPTIFCFAGR